MKCVHVIISGRVQGVWFRGWTADAAADRGLDGWVRNRRDGTVEAAFAGEPGQVDDMVRACWRGPPPARVVSVETFDCDSPVPPGFATLPSA